jgi:hypothetical protein
MRCPIMSIGREIPQQQEKTPHSAKENEFGHVPSMKMVVAGLAQCDSDFDCFSLRLRALHWRLTSGGYHRSRLPNVKCWRSPLLAKFVKQVIQATSAFVPIIIGPRSEVTCEHCRLEHATPKFLVLERGQLLTFRVLPSIHTPRQRRHYPRRDLVL